MYISKTMPADNLLIYRDILKIKCYIIVVSYNYVAKLQFHESNDLRRDPCLENIRYWTLIKGGVTMFMSGR
jgi:hypothetical protein